MNAPELLATVEARGVSMRRETDASGAAVLRIRPVALVSDLLPEIARFKPALLELLETPELRAETAETPNLSPDAPNGPQTEVFGFDGTAEIQHLARVILECVRPGGGFSFGDVKPYWRAANDLTGVSMTSQELGIWARAILAEKTGENHQ